MYTADVLLNGQFVGGTNYGYVGFDIDLSDRLKYGEDNLIEVIADTREPGNSRWYTGGGLIRNVSLISTPKDLYFERHPLYITTCDNRYVSISAEITNRTNKTPRVALEILDPDGQSVYCDTIAIKRHKMTRRQEARIATDIAIPNPKIWDLDTPYLYTVKAQLLHDNGDPLIVRLNLILRMNLLAVQDEMAAVDRINTSQHIGQRGLSGSVLTDQGMNFTLVDIK
jgi:beta-galactosidase